MYMAHIGKNRNACRVLWENMKETDHFKDLRTDKKIILKWFFNRLEWHGLD
jgi:hypothetical protein